ncbi:MAG: hypothetical protein GY719_26415 [bacterium]|nr:hypothetical protein [bacterium]
MDQTVTVLTFDLPPELAVRLNRLRQRLPATSLRDIALEALEEWAKTREGEME